MRAAGVVLALSLVGSPLAGQDEFIVSVRAATVRYHDQAAAIADGYRRIGPDFPTMGEHWLSIPLVVRDTVDPLHPPILEYVTVDGRPVLAGVAYTRLVRGGLPRSAIPAPPSAWHFHRGAVDEESFILSHAQQSAAAMAHSEGPRIGVLHAWLWLENPAGLFATDNWALPWYRLSIPPPPSSGAPSPVGMAAALASGGEGYFATLLRLRQHLTAEQGNRVAAVLRRHARDLRARLRPETSLDRRALDDLGRAWLAVEAELRTVCASCALREPEHDH